MTDAARPTECVGEQLMNCVASVGPTTFYVKLVTSIRVNTSGMPPASVAVTK